MWMHTCVVFVWEQGMCVPWSVRHLRTTQVVNLCLSHWLRPGFLLTTDSEESLDPASHIAVWELGLQIHAAASRFIWVLVTLTQVLIFVYLAGTYPEAISLALCSFKNGFFHFATYDSSRCWQIWKVEKHSFFFVCLVLETGFLCLSNFRTLPGTRSVD